MRVATLPSTPRTRPQIPEQVVGRFAGVVTLRDIGIALPWRDVLDIWSYLFAPTVHRFPDCVEGFCALYAFFDVSMFYVFCLF